MGRSQNLYKMAKKIIPGGTQLLSKRPEMFLPDLWPAYYERARGCEIWDLDGNKYTDMSYMGIGACILGYADQDVNKAVRKTINKGNMSTLNAPEEVELAKLLIKLHPWADMVRYARTGGEAMAIAVRIARAKTGKDKILFCGYHGWHDWYLAANLSSSRSLDDHLLPGLSPLGVPRCLKGTANPFFYNDTEGFLKLIKMHGKETGAVVLESIRNVYPTKDFLQAVMITTKKMKIPLIIDEVSAGWRLICGGAHLVLGIEPDIAVFAKGISNGFPMAAIVGKKGVMTAAEDTFISSTYWTDRVGPVAALATINKIKKNNVISDLSRIGREVQEAWKSVAISNRIDIEISGIYPLSHFAFKHTKHTILKTLFTQMMLNEGFLATNAFYASYSHKDWHVKKYVEALNRTFKRLAKIISNGSDLAGYLKSRECASGFKRLA